ncbi:MAG: gliding motility protein GldM [Cyclobacteriaceae bacterium]
MAGGKETPRQKMIGMMYLVLTALLALQVSNAVLEKFAIINVTLEELVRENNVKNEQHMQAIVEAGKGKTNPKVLKAVENAQKVRALTKETVAKIDELKGKMIALSGTDQIDEKLINDHSSKVATMMIDPRSPVGKEFEQSLNNYITQLEQLTGEKYEKIAKSPAEIDFFKDDPDHNKKDFLTFTFENTPPIAALASVNEFTSEMMEIEAKALEKLAVDAETGTIKLNKIIPMVKPKAERVAAGDKYEADMFLAGSMEGLTPKMFRNGQPLPVEPDPATGVMMGKVSFLASASNYDANGLSKQTFEAEIRLSDDNPDQIYKMPIEYYVIKPTIRVTTGNLPTLYMGCGNLVNIEVPALGTNYNPTFTPNGAQVIKGDKPGRVTIVPTQRKVTVTVANGGAVLGTETFDVKNVPRPRFVAKDNANRDIDMKNGVRGATLTGLRIVAEAEENFKEEVPRDANYRIRGMEVILARGTQQVARITANSEILDLAQWRSQFRPGDRIIVDIKSATRRTFQGNDEKVDIRSEVLTIPIQ